jgi:hypothetical protein
MSLLVIENYGRIVRFQRLGREGEESALRSFGGRLCGPHKNKIEVMRNS